ncbi:hypothetical protein GDO78_001042 [Eleutherodactylus coqui]|uniref:Uncharacterized protein n=1 Tax=Eleutherodactylus coqui TaxID=57060 RepID=A0A8J6KHY1_ELECQ|nr:hypothetical protein GDO78_001042 [Eleutherodactylus coqui]
MNVASPKVKFFSIEAGGTPSIFVWTLDTNRHFYCLYYIRSFTSQTFHCSQMSSDNIVMPTPQLLLRNSLCIVTSSGQILACI